MPPLTRGPLPAGVYWRRRVFVLALAATLVFVIANVLGGGSDARDDEVPTAQQAGGEVDASQTITVDEGKKKNRKGKRNRSAPQGPTFDPNALVEPDGNCDAADVRVTPRIESGVAGEPVLIGLSLQTVQAEACYFRIGSDKITIKVTRDGREVWTSRECPEPVPDESVIVRRMVATVVEMQWIPHPVGTRRGHECPGADEWLLPNDYTVTAAALGGEPAETDFELTAPVRETIPPDPKGDRKGKRGGDDRAQEQDDQRQDDERQDDERQNDEPTDTSTDEPRR